jgi:hypothetical protein
MTYRNDFDAIAARHARLAADLDATKKELDATARKLAEAKAKAKLPVLPNLRVASPCKADWNAMITVDGERVRHCGDCQKNVYNLSNMTRDEAEAVIVAHEGKLCVRYYQRKDGTILLKDCTVGVATGRKRRWIAAGVTALLAGGGSFAANTLSHAGPPPEEEHYDQIQGGIGEMPVQGGIEAPIADPPPTK